MREVRETSFGHWPHAYTLEEDARNSECRRVRSKWLLSNWAQLKPKYEYVGRRSWVINLMSTYWGRMRKPRKGGRLLLWSLPPNKLYALPKSHDNWSKFVIIYNKNYSLRKLRTKFTSSVQYTIKLFCHPSIVLHDRTSLLVSIYSRQQKIMQWNGEWRERREKSWRRA